MCPITNSMNTFFIQVNNAGFMLVGGYEKTTIDDVDTMYNINLRPIFILTQLCIPHLIESKGNNTESPVTWPKRLSTEHLGSQSIIVLMIIS